MNVLRQIEVAIANGKTARMTCKDAGISEQRPKELEQENSKLKRLVAELSMDKQISCRAARRCHR